MKDTVQTRDARVVSVNDVNSVPGALFIDGIAL